MCLTRSQVVRSMTRQFLVDMMMKNANRGSKLTVMCLIAVLVCTSVNVRASSRIDTQAIEQVKSGRETVANAAWWGFDEAESTHALQSAIDSGAPRVFIPNMGKPWIVDELFLQSDQVIEFEPGVELVAKKGAFLSDSDSLLSAIEKSNITIIGNGATLRMHKDDYTKPPYIKAEWRMGIRLDSCRNVAIYNLRIKDTGGDGIYLGVRGDKQRYCENITIKGVICDNNFRQGISLISGANVLIEDCVFMNTSGTAPSAGIDLEPDNADHRLENIVVRRCLAQDNDGPGFMVYANHLRQSTQPVSVLFEDCVVRRGKKAALVVGAFNRDGPDGLIEFRSCLVEDNHAPAVQVYDKDADRAKVVFQDCTWKRIALHMHSEADVDPETATSRGALPQVPIVLYRREDAKKIGDLGGIDFRNCTLVDTKIRSPIVAFARGGGEGYVSQISGTIRVQGPLSSVPQWKLMPRDIDLDLIREP